MSAPPATPAGDPAVWLVAATDQPIPPEVAALVGGVHRVGPGGDRLAALRAAAQAVPERVRRLVLLAGDPPGDDDVAALRRALATTPADAVVVRAAPVTDSLRRVADDRLVEVVPRDDLHHLTEVLVAPAAVVRAAPPDADLVSWLRATNAPVLVVFADLDRPPVPLPEARTPDEHGPREG